MNASTPPRRGSGGRTLNVSGHELDFGEFVGDHLQPYNQEHGRRASAGHRCKQARVYGVVHHAVSQLSQEFFAIAFATRQSGAPLQR
jgi:hypothetical protein